MASRQERLLLLEAAGEDIELQQVLLEKCQRDILYWFENFCWTFNPRVAPHTFPFNLYPFQEKVVLTIQECIETGDSLLIKKSRDMGATWLILLCFQYYWMFVPGSDFHMTTRKQDDIDRKGVRSTLFEKLRFNLRWMPDWMRPEMKGVDDSCMKLINPLNGNAITGEAPVMDFARSQRYKAIMMDEAARLPYGQASYDSASQSSDCIILPYTPYGKTHFAFKLYKSQHNDRVEL